MKKLFLGILVLGLLLSTSAFSVNKNVGTGELQLSDDIVEHFIHYIKLSGQEQPSAMYVRNGSEGTPSRDTISTITKNVSTPAASAPTIICIGITDLAR